MPAQFMVWVWTVREGETGIQLKAIEARTRERDYIVVSEMVEGFGCRGYRLHTIPRTVIRRTTRRPYRSMKAKLTNPKRKLVAPTTIDTATGLLNPTIPKRVDE